MCSIQQYLISMILWVTYYIHRTLSTLVCIQMFISWFLSNLVSFWLLLVYIFQGFLPERYISTINHAWVTPFWSGTLDMCPVAWMSLNFLCCHRSTCDMLPRYQLDKHHTPFVFSPIIQEKLIFLRDKKKKKKGLCSCLCMFMTCFTISFERKNVL